MSYEKFLELKSNSGLHSPSIFEMRSDLNIKINIDACFLCNPYAFELFQEKYSVTDIMDYLKYYPPQNKNLAKKLGNSVNMNPDYILVGNGAIQLIELILRELQGKRKCIITPTFSSYYEFDEENISFFQTYKEDDFQINTDKLIEFCLREKVESLVIVNPNNPTGRSMNRRTLNKIIKSLPEVTVIIDESFIDFYDRSNSMEKEVYSNPNLIVIRSLSKDFGIAGLRLGYAILNPKKRESILQKYGLLWNINGLAHFFLETMMSEDFQKDYEHARTKYLDGKRSFYENLRTLKKVRVYDSDANFFIIDCFDKVNEVFSQLLFDYGIYTRILNDKLHLESSFLRIACGKDDTNIQIFEALNKIEKTL